MSQDLSIARLHLQHMTTGTPDGLLDGTSATLAADGPLRVAYAPFEHIETTARLVVVGITPGRSQALTAYGAAQSALRTGASVEEALRRAKLTASFSGAMRTNLLALLDAIGVPHLLSVASSADLFDPGSGLAHLTSALRYPVFVNGQNYNGTPDMLRTPILRRMVETHLSEEARLLPGALWLPLGPKPAAALDHLARMGRIDPDRVLAGLPHPSGANAERIAVFLGRKPPEAASRQTNGPALLAARARLVDQITRLEGEVA